MAFMISDMVATGRNGGDCARAGITSRSSATIRIIPPGSKPAAAGNPCRALLLVFLGLAKRIRGSHEELSSIRQRQIPTVDAVQAILREIAGDDDLCSDRQ